MNKKHLVWPVLGIAVIAGFRWQSKTEEIDSRPQIKDERSLTEIVETEQKQRIDTRRAEQAGQEKVTDEPIQLEKAGVTFKADKAPPVEKLIDDPELGKVVEITYADGSKLYRHNDPVYDWASGKLSEPLK